MADAFLRGTGKSETSTLIEAYEESAQRWGFFGLADRCETCHDASSSKVSTEDSLRQQH